MRYLGIDYGSKRVGLAVSDDLGRMGFPLEIVPNNKHLLEELLKVIQREHIGAVVIGESKDFSGKDNPIAEEARALVEKLKNAGIEIFFEPETFTSAEARRAHAKTEKTHAPKARAAIDDSAAALILTSYLSRINHG